jgi:hypothetical protein
MGIQDDIFDVQADLEKAGVDIAHFERIVTYLGNTEAAQERAEEDLMTIVAGAATLMRLVERWRKREGRKI